MLRFGTRNSALALAQAQLVVEWVATTEKIECQLVPLTSAGDRGERPSDKSRWVLDLERAILTEEIDFAIHSAKDVPGDLADGLEIVATYPERGDARDVLCGSRSIDDLAPGARVGTSSLRRRSQLLARRPDLIVTEIRGNIDTRILKLNEGQFDAIMLAAAGLDRIGQSAVASCRLRVADFVPAPGQGTLLIEGKRDGRQLESFTGLTPELLSERTLVAQVGADCHSPVGAYAVVKDDGTLELSTYIGLPDGQRWITDKLTGRSSNAEEIALELAERVRSVGADEILAESRPTAA